VVQFFAIFYILVTFICVVGNFLVIYVFLSNKELRIPGNLFVVNLAVSDSGIFLTQGPLMFINAFSSQFWMWGAFMCKLYGFLGAAFGTASIMNLVAVGYDRYNVICNGLAGARIKYSHAMLVSLFIWVYAVAACIPPYFGWGAYKLEGLFITCTYEYVTDHWNPRSFMLFAFVFSYILPLAMVAFYYTSIVRAVFFNQAALQRAELKMMQDQNRRRDSIPGDIPNPEKIESMEMQVAKVAISNVLLWFLAWTPYAIVCLIGSFGNRELVTPMVSQIPAFLAKLSSAINPVVTALSHPRYREALLKQFSFLGTPKSVDETPTKMERIDSVA